MPSKKKHKPQKQKPQKHSSPLIGWGLILATFLLMMVIYQATVPSSEPPESFHLPQVDTLENQSAPEEDNIPVSELDPASLDEQVLEDIPLTAPIESSQETISPEVSVVEYKIKSGDTLAKIFKQQGLSLSVMYQVLEADQEYLALEPIITGNSLFFVIDANGVLQKISRPIDASKTISYQRHESGGYSYQEDIKPISYYQTAYHTQIKGSFYLTAKKIGLSDANILSIHGLLKGYINFSKDLQAGDAFDVVIQQGEVDGEKVGGSQIEAIQITVKGHTYQAFRHTDGHYYDSQGLGLTPSLRRWPTAKHYRVSSPFNGNRLHPITGRPAPHNGVDLATPIGTKILATGNGVVTRVADHKYAGKYLVIDNPGPYSSRYLHLDKVLVKKGDKVQKGQVIALSGNTGRTTGAHLHYELHIKGKPVNPMTATIPTSQSIEEDQRAAFSEQVAKWREMLEAS